MTLSTKSLLFLIGLALSASLAESVWARPESRTELNKKIATLKKRLEKQPDNLDLHYSLGILYYKRGDKDSAIKHLKRTNEEPNVKRLKFLIKVLEEKNDQLEVIRTLTILSGQLPQSPNVFTSLGDAYLKINKIDKSIENYKIAISKYKKHRPAYDGLLNVFRTTKNAYELKNTLADMLLIFGNDAKILTDLCSLDYLGGFLDSAISSCQAAIGTKSDVPENHVYLGLTFQALKKEDQGNKIILSAAKQFPKSEIAQMEAGKISEASSNWEAAVKYYKTCTKNNSKSVSCYLGLGRASMGGKQFENGISAFIQACELDRTKYPELLKAMGDLRTSGFEDWSRKFKEKAQNCGI